MQGGMLVLTPFLFLTPPLQVPIVCVQAFATGAIRVWNELYTADTALSSFLPRKDERWERVGLSVRRPRLEDLKRVFRIVGQGSVVHYGAYPAATPSLDEQETL